MDKPAPFESVKTRDGEEHEVRSDNTSVFTFLGKWAMFNHIYIGVDGEPDGIFIWEKDPMSGRSIDMYDFLMPKAIENGCKAFLDAPEPEAVDFDAYTAYASVDIGDFPPDFN